VVLPLARAGGAGVGGVLERIHFEFSNKMPLFEMCRLFDRNIKCEVKNECKIASQRQM
jgi:hypothetical protein